MYDEDEPSEEEFERALERNRAWVTDRELASLGLERATGLHATESGKPESPVEQANRMMRENAPLAAAALVKLVRKGESETVRLRASIEILNRANAAGSTNDGTDPWTGLYNKVVVPASDKQAAEKTAADLRAKGVKPYDKDLP